MKLAIDSNVLVRYLTWDDPTQATAAAKAIESAETVAISTIVLCEVVWVLRRAYRHDSATVASTLRGVIESRNVEVDRAAAEAGLSMLVRGGDFADGAIQYEAERAKCDRMVTFDRGFAERGAGANVVLLGDQGG